jgi:spermidine synthase
LRFLLLVLFAVTGATSLAYQLAWSRFLALAFGGTLLTTSAVVACFLTGLALGGLVFGRIADRLSRPLALYGVLEAAVALYALATPALAQALRSALGPSPVGFGTVLGATAAYLLPPTFLMGGTFPALLGALAGTAAPRRSAALLYGANTAGAVAGVLLAAFVSLRTLGLAGTVHLFAAVNLAAALVALGLSTRLGARDRRRTVAPAVAGRAADATGPVLLVLALSGAAALLGEIAWTRALALVLGSSVYAFALVLGAFLLGIALGSLGYARRASTDPMADLVHYQTRAAAAAFLFAVLLTASPRLLLTVLQAGHGRPVVLAGGAFAVAFGATAYATTALGAAFPAGLAALLARLPPGRASGLAYAANTVGAVAGSLLTAAWLIPRLGLPTTLAAGVALNLVAAWVASSRAARQAAVAVLGTLLAVTALPWWWRHNLGLLTSGVYAYAYRYAAPPARPPAEATRVGARAPVPSPPVAAVVAPAAEAERGDLVFVGDGRHANVAVLRDRRGNLALLIDGKVDASTARDGDMRTQLLLGYLPLLFHQGPVERSLVIGLGSGVTASALLDEPGTAVDVVEIEPLVAEVAGRYFSAANRHVLASDRVHLILGDGRRWVTASRGRYAILTSEPSNLWMSGVTHLFTAEFFAEAARALRPGGVLCQWMHLYQVSADDVRVVLRGLLQSFPHAHMFADGPDLLIVAGRTPLPRPDQVRPGPAAASALADVGIVGADGIARLWLGDDTAMRRFSGSGRLHTDDAPVLEFTAPLSLARDHSADILAALGRASEGAR